jgi:hypothetical protein
MIQAQVKTGHLRLKTTEYIII